MPGDVFTLGTHSWQILRVDGLKVRVRDAFGMHPTVPFWLERIQAAVENYRNQSQIYEQLAELLTDDSANAAIQYASENIGLPPQQLFNWSIIYKLE